MSNDLVVANDNDLAVFGGVGAGAFADEVKFPFLTIAAKNTDMIIRESGKYIEGLEAGFFVAPESKTVVGKSVQMIVLAIVNRYKESKVNGNDREFVRIVPSYEIRQFAPAQLREYLKNTLPNGNILDEEKLIYCVLPDFRELGVLMFSVGVGGFKHVRNWGAMIVKTGDPFPSHIWKLTTGFMSKDINGKKTSWFTLGDNDNTFIEDLGRVPKDMLSDVVEAWKMVDKFIKSEESGGASMKSVQTHAAIGAPDNEDDIPY